MATEKLIESYPPEEPLPPEILEQEVNKLIKAFVTTIESTPELPDTQQQDPFNLPPEKLSSETPVVFLRHNVKYEFFYQPGPKIPDLYIKKLVPDVFYLNGALEILETISLQSHSKPEYNPPSFSIIYQNLIPEYTYRQPVISYENNQLAINEIDRFLRFFIKPTQ